MKRRRLFRHAVFMPSFFIIIPSFFFMGLSLRLIFELDFEATDVAMFDDDPAIAFLTRSCEIFVA